MLWIILSLMAVGIAFLLSSRIYITCTYRCENHMQFLHIQIHMFTLRLYQKHIQMNSETKGFWERIQEMDELNNITQLRKRIRTFFNSFGDVKNMAKTILHDISVHQINWHTHLGVKDADVTGVVTGMVWIAKGIMIACIDRVSHLQCTPDISIVPYFQQTVIESEVKCMISIKVGNAMFRAFQLIQKLFSTKEVYMT